VLIRIIQTKKIELLINKNLKMKMKLLLGSVAFFLSALVFGQETGKLEIKGAVKDNKGVGLQGITITEKNTANVSITNGTGEFTIKVGSCISYPCFQRSWFPNKRNQN
jgi:hypothetical protein